MSETVNGPNVGREGTTGDQKAFKLAGYIYQHKVASLIFRYVPQG